MSLENLMNLVNFENIGKLHLYGRAIHHIETTNVRSRREVTAGWCVAQYRRCVADLATSQPYLYEVLGDKADTIDAEHLRHTLYKISHPSRHRIVIVLQNIKKERAGVSRLPLAFQKQIL